MKASGSTTKLTAKELIFMQMVPGMLASGRMINNTGMERRAGLMAPFTGETTSKERKTEKENFLLLMLLFTREVSS